MADTLEKLTEQAREYREKTKTKRQQPRGRFWTDAEAAERDLREAREYIESLPANWHEDSSLKTWFPITAEELERTKTELAALRRLQGGNWVSVKERLPEDGSKADYALVIDGGKGHKYRRWGLYRGGGVWSGDGGFMFSAHDPVGVHCVTHWLELPAPPAAETEREG